MTLIKSLRQKLTELEPSSDRHDHLVADADSGSAVTLAIVQRDAMSCKAMELSVRRPAPSGLDMGDWAKKIAARVTSLLEPLQVLEVDAQRQQALLRSTIGAQQQETPSYFEIILEGTTSATVRRYHAAQAQTDTAAAVRRAQVAFALTHEALLKLVSDLLGV